MNRWLESMEDCTSGSMNQWINEWTNESMEGWLSHFFVELLLHWATSSLRYLLSQLLLWAASYLGYFFSDPALSCLPASSSVASAAQFFSSTKTEIWLQSCSLFCRHRAPPPRKQRPYFGNHITRNYRTGEPHKSTSSNKRKTAVKHGMGKAVKGKEKVENRWVWKSCVEELCVTMLCVKDLCAQEIKSIQEFCVKELCKKNCVKELCVKEWCVTKLCVCDIVKCERVVSVTMLRVNEFCV